MKKYFTDTIGGYQNGMYFLITAKEMTKEEYNMQSDSYKSHYMKRSMLEELENILFNKNSYVFIIITLNNRLLTEKISIHKYPDI